MATIPANVNWVEDVCWMNLVSVAQNQNQIYYVGGYSYLRSTSAPSRGGILLANSHLYALAFSSSVDLEKNYSSLFTSVTRLPDLVPRISRGNFVWRESSLNLLGGAQTTFPIFLSNGSFSLLDRVPIGDALFTHNLLNANTWTRNSPFDYGGMQNTPIGKAAKAFDELSDDGKGIHEKFMVVHRGVAIMEDSNSDEYAGLMIVNLVTLEWVTGIDVSGGDVVYSVPELVSRIVGGNGAGGATFNPPTNGFVDSPLYSVFNVTSTSPLNLNASTTTIPTSSTSSPSPVPKVVGGVLGGLVLIIIILSCILLFLRRHRKQQE
ncbi:hypothetical protein EV426DRAFT_686858 [Tirmania nivea]|nr:hypothetical protein EV426DRAFT_686858 [Tirmania nivea]